MRKKGGGGGFREGRKKREKENERKQYQNVFCVQMCIILRTVGFLATHLLSHLLHFNVHTVYINKPV